MRRFWSSRALRRTCTWAGRRAFATRGPVAHADASRSCAITWPAAWAAPRATGRSWRRCRSRSTTRCGSTTASSTVDRHVHHSSSPDLERARGRGDVRAARRDRPLWELWIADELPDGRVGVIGKAHHAMVDGLAAVELAIAARGPHAGAAPSRSPTAGRRRRPPDVVSLLADALADRAGEALKLARWPLRHDASTRAAGRPGRRRAAERARARGLAAGGGAADRPQRADLSAAATSRGHGDRWPTCSLIKGRFGATVNDVVLAVAWPARCARFLESRGEPPVPLKTMVPVSVRGEDGASSSATRSRSCSWTCPATSRTRCCGSRG